VSRFTALTGDPGYAASALLEQLALSSQETVAPADVLSAARAVIQTGFGGSSSAYQAAVVAARLTLGDARSILIARLERDKVEASFRPLAPTPAAIADFLATYRDQSTRLVSSATPAPWLGGAAHGWVISSLAPAELFTLTAPGRIDTADGAFQVTPATAAVPLGLLPTAEAATAARQALDRLARQTIYRGWLRSEETTLLATASCLDDQIPTAEATDLSPFVPFLFST
jgi:hypothetical protein